jgi:hypothetical protein
MDGVELQLEIMDPAECQGLLAGRRVGRLCRDRRVFAGLLRQLRRSGRDEQATTRLIATFPIRISGGHLRVRHLGWPLNSSGYV